MAEPPKPSAGAEGATKSTAEHVKETLESIVIAFILAFVFRAFIVEAFVIPTGSMAATLYGQQLTNTCSTCGYEYAVGITAEKAASAINQPGHAHTAIRCPNCDMQRDQLTAARMARPDSGDRILVHKWPFDLAEVAGDRFGPKRWDVTVFKDPRDGRTNFIKRLVGLPGEMLEIIDGDVYTAPIERLRKEEPGLIEEMDELRLEVYEAGQAGSRQSVEAIRKRYADVNRRLLPHLEIQRKTERAQRSLWSNVYNHDFLPNRDLLRPDQLPNCRVGWHPDENAAEAWDASAREIRFESSQKVPLFIQFGGKPIEDFYAYNADGAGGPTGPPMQMPVGDLRLRFTWFPDAGGGGLVLAMNRNRDAYQVEVGVDGSLVMTLGRADNGRPEHPDVLARAELPAFAPGEAVEINFANVDYRTALQINGQEVLVYEHEPAVETLARWADPLLSPQARADMTLPSTVRIGASDLSCRLRHVVLERDVYYRSQRQAESGAADDAGGRHLNPYFEWPGWGTAGFPIMLRTDREVDGQRYRGEYFMLGDNSPASKDSRLWWEVGPHLRHLGSEYQVGTVPQDQLIGKAFFVYWPAGYRSFWTGGLGLVPNFGEMRWIR